MNKHFTCIYLVIIFTETRTVTETVIRWYLNLVSSCINCSLQNRYKWIAGSQTSDIVLFGRSKGLFKPQIITINITITILTITLILL